MHASTNTHRSDRTDAHVPNRSSDRLERLVCTCLCPQTHPHPHASYVRSPIPTHSLKNAPDALGQCVMLLLLPHGSFDACGALICGLLPVCVDANVCQASSKQRVSKKAFREATSNKRKKRRSQQHRLGHIDRIRWSTNRNRSQCDYYGASTATYRIDPLEVKRRRGGLIIIRSDIPNQIKYV